MDGDEGDGDGDVDGKHAAGARVGKVVSDLPDHDASK